MMGDLTDVTLADEDTNLIPTDEAKKANLGNVAMQVAPPGGKICNKCKWPHLLAKFGSYETCGQICNQYK